jgi:nucleotide-binding universal stress UspA family protein
MRYSDLLVFLEFPNPTRPSPGLAKTLSYLDVTLVGFHQVDSAAELSSDRETEIEATLTDIASEFEESGIRVQTHVVTGESVDQTRNEWAKRDDIDGVLIPAGVDSVGRVVVGVRDVRRIDRIADFVDLVDRDRIIHITLLHVAPESDSEATIEGREALDEMKAQLTERGVNPMAIDSRIRVSDDPEHELTTVARNYDLTVLGETVEPGLKSEVFGPVSNRVANRANSAVLVVG